MSTFDGLIEALLAEIRVPVLLKALSEGVDVAGVQRICFATFARSGNWKECSLHQPNTLVLDMTGSRERYILNSS